MPRDLGSAPSPERSHSPVRTRRLLVVAALVGAATCILALGALEVPLCPFRAATGLPCPGCGLTRATLALLAGDVSSAVGHHPLVLVVVPASVWALARFATARRVALPKSAWWALAGAFLALWATRLATSPP